MTAKRNILIALMLLLIVAASACAFSACDFPAEAQTAIATDDAGNPMYSGETYVMPSGMAFSASASTAAEENASVILTAVYEPADTANKQTIWSVAFVNPSSSWAAGKTVTDYVTVDSTGVNTAKVTCLQAFGEQIVITATSAVNSFVSETTTVDYEKKYLDLEFSLLKNGVLVGSALASELKAGLTSEYFGLTYIKNDQSVITTYPYYRITAKIDATGKTTDKYTVRVTPVFSLYSLDKTYGNVLYLSGSSTQYGEQFSEIDGSENFTLPSGYFTAPGYYSYGYNVHEKIVDLFDKAQTFVDNPSQSNYFSLAFAMLAYQGAADSGTFDNESVLVILAATSLMDTATAAIESADYMTEEGRNYIAEQIEPAVSSVSFDISYYFDGKELDLGSYATPEEYFSNNPAKQYTRISINGEGYQIEFRFNADSL